MQSFRASTLIPLGFLADDAVNDSTGTRITMRPASCDEPVSGVWSGVRADPSIPEGGVAFHLIVFQHTSGTPPRTERNRRAHSQVDFKSTIYRPFQAARSPAANHLSSLTATKVECGDPARTRKEAVRSCRIWSAILAENPYGVGAVVAQ